LIKINDQIVKPHYSVIENDEIIVDEEPKVRTLIKKILNPKARPPKLNIIFEDDDIIVLDKPSGLLVHVANDSWEPTLVDALLAHDKRIAKVGTEEYRAGIIHRLDKLVSGVMVAVKNQNAFNHLKDQFKERTIEKEYTALVYGQMEKDNDEIRFKIARSRDKGRMVARPTSQEGKEAITKYQVIKRFTNATLLKVKILTGRTHQIRAHLHALGYPIIGDPLYQRKDIKWPPIERIFLHSTILGFKLPSTGENKTFSSPLPNNLNEYLDGLKEIMTKP